MKREQINGVIPVIVTPFVSQDEVDSKGLEGLTEYLVSKGVYGIMCSEGFERTWSIV